jgi:hypothetical protein
MSRLVCVGWMDGSRLMRVEIELVRYCSTSASHAGSGLPSNQWRLFMYLRSAGGPCAKFGPTRGKMLRIILSCATNTALFHLHGLVARPDAQLGEQGLCQRVLAKCFPSCSATYSFHFFTVHQTTQSTSYRHLLNL